MLFNGPTRGTVSPLKERLLNELRLRLGTLMVEDEVETAIKLADAASTILNDCNNDAELQSQFNALYMELDAYQRETEDYPVAVEAEWAQESCESMVSSLSLEQEPEQADSKPDPPKVIPSGGAVQPRKQTNQNILIICGDWPRLSNSKSFHIMYFDKHMPAQILDILQEEQSLGDETESVLIALNTSWAGHNEAMAIEQLYYLCRYVQEQNPNTKIKVGGFYAKNEPHLDSFNRRLESVCNKHRIAEYVDLEQLAKPNERQLLPVPSPKRGLNERAIIRMLQRFADL